jgi:hypothetical protein
MPNTIRIKDIPLPNGDRKDHNIQKPNELTFDWFIFDNMADIKEKIIRYSSAIALLDEITKNSKEYLELFIELKKIKNKIPKTNKDFNNYQLMSYIKDRTRNFNFNTNIYTVEQWELKPAALFEPNTNIITLHLDDNYELQRIKKIFNLKDKTKMLQSLDLLVVSATDLLTYNQKLNSGYRQFEVLKYIIENTETPIYPIVVDQKQKKSIKKLSPILNERINIIDYYSVSQGVVDIIAIRIKQKIPIGKKRGLTGHNLKRLRLDAEQLTLETLFTYRLKENHLRTG